MNLRTPKLLVFLLRGKLQRGSNNFSNTLKVEKYKKAL
jgi:hypothetical protein